MWARRRSQRRSPRCPAANKACMAAIRRAPRSPSLCASSAKRSGSSGCQVEPPTLPVCRSHSGRAPASAATPSMVAATSRMKQAGQLGALLRRQRRRQPGLGLSRFWRFAEKGEGDGSGVHQRVGRRWTRLVADRLCPLCQRLRLGRSGRASGTAQRDYASSLRHAGDRARASFRAPPGRGRQAGSASALRPSSW